uniref:FTP domain-containing protein n=1 Tax=Macrostomum lignano TaxID=282301 RepID=A0A1I8JJF4_9PLAT
SASGIGRLNCAEDCSTRSGCFGFTWLPGLCRLFSLSAFYNLAWESSAECDVYTLNTTKLNFVACNQSSVMQNGVCERAFDGNKNQDYWGGLSCIHTDNNGQPGWWEAQLAAPAQISHVTIYNRADCCSSRLNKMSLTVDGVECHRVDLTVAFSIATFSCNAFGSKFAMINLQAFSITMFTNQ